MAGTPITGAIPAKSQAILYYLAVSGKRLSESTLVTLLWHTADESSVNTDLRQALSDLSQLVGDYLEINHHFLNLKMEHGFWVDTVEFEGLVSQPGSAVDLRQLEAAVGLYRGDFLSGFSVSHAPAFEAWLLDKRARLRNQLFGTLHRLATEFENQEDLTRSISHTRQMIGMEPRREKTYRQLMRLLARNGQPKAALAEYEAFRRALKAEAGVEPEQRTRVLFERLRGNDVNESVADVGQNPTVHEPAALTISDRFEIANFDDDLLGQGTMGKVFRGLDRQTGLPVAIKLLKPEVVAGAPEMMERFSREGNALRQLNHPNIIKLLAAIEENNHHYLVMEYMSGGSLRHLLDQQGPIPAERTIDIGLELADALTRAHHLDIIHRDLKPSNVLLAEDGTPRLADFGVAHLGTHARLTQSGVVLGTIEYLSPEVINGEALDTQADIWAFGVLLYEMLTGELPFHGANIAAKIAAILSRPLPDLRTRRPDLPTQLVELISQMLIKDPRQRLASVRMVGAELEAAKRGQILARGRHKEAPVQAVQPTVEPISHNLPHQATPFVGRKAELESLVERLLNPVCRLLTMVGPGGIGKTRLAIQVAQKLADQPLKSAEFVDGIIFVPLAPISTPAGVVPAIAEAAGFNFYSQGSPRQQLLDYLQSKAFLLVLDNFEHLLESTELVAEILRRAPALKILVTSREALDLHEAWFHPIAGLSFPDDTTRRETATLATVEEYDAIQLFVQTARRMQAGFAIDAEQKNVVRICQLVEGMPLGIELAAAWLKMLPAAKIADEIRGNLDILTARYHNIPERHRSLRAVFEHSWQRLADDDQMIFNRLSVFRGTFDRGAAEGVADASLMNLAVLVEKSLLRVSDDFRYQLHELLRQFAEEKLKALPEDDTSTRLRHSAYYLDFIKHREVNLKGGDQYAALTEIGNEIKNIQAGWNWAVANGQFEKIDQAQDALYHFYWLRSRYQEGLEAFKSAAERITEANFVGQRSDLVLARLEARQGAFCSALGNYDTAELLLDKCLNVARKLDAQKEIAFALNFLGDVARDQGNYTEAGRRYRESLTLSRAIGDQRGMAYALFGLGFMDEGRGNFLAAKGHYSDSLDLYRQANDRVGVANGLDKLGLVAFSLGEYTKARQYYQESLAISQEFNNRLGIALAQGGLGLVAWGMGDAGLVDARSLYEQSLAICRETGHQLQLIVRLAVLGHICNGLRAYDAAQQYSREAISLARAIGFKVGLSFALSALGDAAGAQGDLRTARTHLLEAIEVAWSINDYTEILVALVNWVEYVFRADARSPATDYLPPGQQDLLLETLALTLTHPSSRQVFKNKAARLLKELTSKVPDRSQVEQKLQAGPRPLESIVFDILKAQNL